MGIEKNSSEAHLNNSSTDLHQQTLVYLAAGLKARKFSSVELTQALLEWVEKINPTINSFVTITRDQALDQARAADELIAHGRGGPLTGIPVAHKDIFCTEGVKTTCGSKMLDNFISPYDATVVARIKQAGMVMLGKTNMDEFAMGSSTETSYYGATKNPWDYAAVPGGSSGGSAAAVAARMVPAATASDTGGSIRQPASFCGVTGIKPTYGRVSRYGMIAYASSLDQGGVIAKTAEDCALLLAAMAGFDPRDSTSVDNDATLDYTATLNEPVSGRKIGVPKEWFGSLQPEVKEAVETAIQEFERLGAEVMEIELPHSPMSIASYYVIAMAEASSNLSRYDGVRFGHRCEDPINLDDLYGRSRTEGFGAEVKRRIMVGAYALSAGYYDQYYIKAQQVRRLISEDFTRAFEKVDFIMGPVAPTTAFDLGENLDDPIQMYLSDIFTLSLNLSGRPGMSVPAGFDARRRPVGLQIIGDFWKEAELLNMAHVYQQHTSWHEEAPSDLV